MFRKKIIVGLVVCVLAMLLVSQSFSAAGGGRGGRGGRGGFQRPQGGQPGQTQRDPEQMRERMRQMMNDRMKEQLGVGDDEWKVIQPRLEKVMELSRQVNASGRGGMFGGSGGPGGFGGRGGRGQDGGQATTTRPSGTQRELSAVEKAAQELRELLASETAKPEQIKLKLTALRKAKEKATQDLAKAQLSLKQLLTVKQEAFLVLAGYLS